MFVCLFVYTLCWICLLFTAFVEGPNTNSFTHPLYLLCSFLMGEEENDITLDTGTGDVFDLKIRCYSMARDKIGTSFPEATAHYDQNCV